MIKYKIVYFLTNTSFFCYISQGLLATLALECVKVA